MKKMMLILVMLLIAATSYNQASRRSANKNVTARNNTKSSSVRATPQDHNTSTRRSSTVNTDRTSRSSSSTSKQTPTARPTSRSATNNNRSATTTTTTRSRTVSTPTRSTSTQNVSRTTPRSSQTSAHHSSTQYTPTRRSQTTTNRRVVTYSSPRSYTQKHVVHHTYHTPPPSIDYRRVHHVYRAPVNVHFYWTPTMHRHFIEIYPMVHTWKYYNGYNIPMISSYDAMYYRGEVMTVYGQVSDVYYERRTDEYFLYFGPYYPYQDFTIVVPGYLARRYSRNPLMFFTNRYLATTGLITTYDGEPEIVVKKDFQISLY